MSNIPQPIIYNTNRSISVQEQNTFNLFVTVPGRTRFIEIYGVIYIPLTMDLLPLCVSSPEDEGFSTSLPLTKLIIYLNGYIRKNLNNGESKWFVREVSIQKLVYPPLSERDRIAVPFSMVFKHYDNVVYDDVIAGIKISSIKDQCGNELYCSTEGIDIHLTVLWDKLPTNACIGCVENV